MAQRIASLLVKLSADSAELKADLRQMKAQLRGVGRTANREANRVKYAFNKIRRAAQVVASAFIFVAGVRQLGNLVSAMAKAEDQVNLLDARFRQFARAGDSFTRIYNLSKELGVSLDDTANGMTRLLVATKEMGTAQSVLEQVHKNIVILGRAGGTSTEEMKGAMRQLSQGLASGRLQGEELRSVLENLPLVAIEIAKQMKISLGQIRKVAQEGKITGQVVVDAVSEIEIKMEDLPKTWAMQTENLRTEWTLFLNDLSKAVDEAGLLETLVDAVAWVRFNVLGSFRGVSTEELKSRQKELKAQVDAMNELQSRRNNTNPANQAMAMVGIDNPLAGIGDAAREVAETLAGFSTGATFGATGSELREEYQKINDELKLRIELEKLAKDAADVKGVLSGMDADAKADKSLASFLRQYETMEQKVARLQAVLEGFRGKIPEDEFKRIAFEIDKDLIQMIDKRLIPKLKEIPEATKEATEEMSEYAKRAAQNMQDAFADFLFDPFDKGVKGMLEGFLTAIRRMIAETAAANFFESAKSGGLGSFISNFLGGRAAGGPVSARGTYLVGERGPELLTMGASSGYITPNHAMGGGTVYNIEAGADVATIMAEVIPALERTKNAAVGEVITRKREGRL